MSEVIPISKTPSQEKAVFIPPKLDWNENGEFSSQKFLINIFSSFQPCTPHYETENF